MKDKSLEDPINKEVLIGDPFDDSQVFEFGGRNKRLPKKANHGARPCSSVMRKLKKKAWYHKTRTY